MDENVKGWKKKYDNFEGFEGETTSNVNPHTPHGGVR